LDTDTEINTGTILTSFENEYELPTPTIDCSIN